MFRIEDYLARESQKDLLRFSTAGSVDDGKSTLIGRLLYDTQTVYEDQVRAIEGKGTTAPGQIDFALLTDGLRAEREQGITIDVAYRYFATDKRKFIIADTPGHEQYTRNMATGASTADATVVLIDASKGAGSVAAPCLHRIVVARKKCSCGRQQDGPDWLQGREFPRYRKRLYAATGANCRGNRQPGRCAFCSGKRLGRRQRRSRFSADALV
jgi:hypothetical protein